MGNKTFTLKELAKLTNTSVNTVSRALNGKDGVSKETREFIEKVAQEHNYRPNLLARSMRSKYTNLIGFLVGDITNPFFTNMLDGAEEEANTESMIIVIGNSNENIEKENKNIDAFISYNCSGIAISPASSNKDVIVRLKKENVNFVILDRPVDDIKCDQVSINNEGDSFRAVNYLLECGHKKIAIINYASTLQTERSRYLGYKRALQQHNIEENLKFIKNCKTKEEVNQVCQDLIFGADKPTALFIAKESLGLNVISFIMNAGLQIPDDISVIIYGDPEWASIFHPRFTCMQRPVKEMGRIGIQILINKVKSEDNEAFKNITLDSKLIIRESVKIL